MDDISRKIIDAAMSLVRDKRYTAVILWSCQN